MKKIMFNRTFGLEQAVLAGTKTMTLRLTTTPSTPHYSVGEKVAIAQSYKNLIEQGYLCRKSDGWISEKYCNSPGYNNKMFVKAEYMPWQIVIVNFKFERLQDICEADIMREGINEGHFMNKFDHYFYKKCDDIYVTFRTPRLAFASLIDHVCGRGTWDSNPWVVSYLFHLQRANM